MKFVKDEEGNWSLDKYYIGTNVDVDTGENFFQHMIDDGTWTLEDFSDFIMANVNDAMKDAGI